MISGHFDQIRSTETEELQTQSDDDEDKKEALEEMARQLEEKGFLKWLFEDLQARDKAKQDAEIEKDEKMAKSEALDSALGESNESYDSKVMTHNTWFKIRWTNIF